MKMRKSIAIREAKDEAGLPETLVTLNLVGAYNGILYIASEEKGTGNIFVYNYSLEENAVKRKIVIEKGSWPTSWTQDDNLLFLGTRSGNLAAIDMENFKEVGNLKNKNCIDCIAVDEDVYFGVNGHGISRADKGLSAVKDTYAEKEKWQSEDGERELLPNASALAFFDNSLCVFYFCNGRDPCLGETPIGGLVELLDKDMKSLTGRRLIKDVVQHAVRYNDKIVFATADERNGWIPQGTGELFLLNPSDLSYESITELPAAVRSLYKDGDNFLAGLKDGQVFKVDQEGLKKKLCSQTHRVSGIVVQDKQIYVGYQNGVIEVLDK